MADSNSKKPMALLLLVVVAVLVVIMVSGGEAEWTGHADLASKEDCEAKKGLWADAVEAAPATKDADGNDVAEVVAADAVCGEPVWAELSEEDCGTAHGTWGGAAPATKDADGNDVAEVADSCSKEAAEGSEEDKKEDGK